ncbi:chromosome condensation regulator rcc1 repeat protein [Anaeramoeba flamelloides]|uniref:Chromosome condensation regulator rcc1 repeat protein n=1 Tax=Anaeramoeba flamelloides TaxID=1746091 RepID=A0AAV7ZFB2_9EUKA|nr:chromosome condensation regulator rcc1 repeat protein [Anaeramoeba flamelloides]
MAFWFAFGDNHKGLLGIRGNREITEIQEMQVIPSSTVKEILSTRTATVFLTVDGCIYTIYAAGSPDETVLHKFETEKINSIESGNGHFIALSQSGSVYTWGGGAVGQLGHGNKQSLESPTKVQYFVGKRPTAVHTAYSTSYVLCEGGDLYAFGNGFNGELGNGKNYSSLKPALVQRGIVKVYSGLSYHLFAKYKNGSFKGWGKNETGQVGSGSKKSLLGPTKLKFFKKESIVNIYPGNDFTLAISGTNHLYSTGPSRNSCQPKDINKFQIIPFFKKMKINHVSIGDEYSLVINESFKIYGFGSKMEVYGSRSNLVQEPTVSIDRRNQILAVRLGSAYSCFIKMKMHSGFMSKRKTQQIINKYKKTNNKVTKKPETTKIPETNDNFDDIINDKINNNNNNKTGSEIEIKKNEMDQFAYEDEQLKTQPENKMKQEQNKYFGEFQKIVKNEDTKNDLNDQFTDLNINKQPIQQQQQTQYTNSNQKQVIDTNTLQKYITKQEFNEKVDIAEQRQRLMLLQLRELKDFDTQSLESVKVLLNAHQNNQKKIGTLSQKINSINQNETSNLDNNDNKFENNIEELDQKLYKMKDFLLAKNEEISQLKNMQRIFQDCIKILQGKNQQIESNLSKVKQLIIKLSKNN